MAEQYSLVIFFDADRLAPAQRLNPLARRKLLQESVLTLQEKFPAVRLGVPLVSSLSVPAQVPEGLLPEFTKFISVNHLGRPQLDGHILCAVSG